MKMNKNSSRLILKEQMKILVNDPRKKFTRKKGESMQISSARENSIKMRKWKRKIEEKIKKKLKTILPKRKKEKRIINKNSDSGKTMKMFDIEESSMKLTI
jgi:hypothetical protein